MQQIQYQNLGTVDYQTAWDLQEGYLQEGLSMKSLKFKNPEATLTPFQNRLLICEHPHVYTLGKSGALENLLVNNQQLQNLGATFFKTNRGGDITYHGPGQMVAYPILDLEVFFTDLGRYMRTLEEAIILTIGEYGIIGDRLPGSTGVWLDPEDPSKARKICAMGVKCSRWLTIHGLALNVNTDLQFFNYIVPCGIVDKGVTSMAKELGTTLDMNEVQQKFVHHFAQQFEATITQEKASMSI